MIILGFYYVRLFSMYWLLNLKFMYILFGSDDANYSSVSFLLDCLLNFLCITKAHSGDFVHVQLLVSSAGNFFNIGSIICFGFLNSVVL